MWNFDLQLLILASSASLLIGLLSYVKNYQNLTNKLFASLTISLVLLSTLNYLSINLTDNSHVFSSIRFILVSVILQNTLFFLFVSAYPGNNFNLKSALIKQFVVFSCIVLALGIFPGFFNDYTIYEDTINPTPSPFIGLFILHTLISSGGGMMNLAYRYKKDRNFTRSQFKFLFSASVILLLLTPITNFLLPIVFSIETFIPFAPFYIFVFSSIIAYSIFRHKLLDIHAVVARATAYFIVIFVVVILYVASANILQSILFSDTDYSIFQLTANVFLTVVLVLVYPNIKKTFDKMTNRLFFQDAYDAQTFIDDFNKALVSNVDTEELLKKSCKLIGENIKAEFVSFYVRDTAYLGGRLISNSKLEFTQEDIVQLHALLPKLHKTVLYVEGNENDKTDVEIKVIRLLKSKNIEVVARVVSTTEYEVDGVGYLLLGPKRSGNLYDAQDLKVLGIIASELEIAIENSLRFEEIEHFNVTLQKKIDNATYALQTSNHKLKALDEAKDEFISMASHQLRTPLTSVKGYLSMVLEGDAGDINETQKKMLQQAFFSSQRMVYLISDLLNVSRLKTGKFVIEAKPTYLPDVVESEIEQLRETAKSRDLKLEYKKPKHFPTINLDETKIRQVIMNFTDNAIYYTPSGGHISLGLKANDKQIEFTVTDDGIGVPKTEQFNLFSKFYRAGNARKARPDGTGLGLFMAKKVIVASGGALLFNSEEGKGSTFGFTFPLEPVAVVDVELDEDTKD